MLCNRCIFSSIIIYLLFNRLLFNQYGFIIIIGNFSIVISSLFFGMIYLTQFQSITISFNSLRFSKMEFMIDLCFIFGRFFILNILYVNLKIIILFYTSYFQINSPTSKTGRIAIWTSIVLFQREV